LTENNKPSQTSLPRRHKTSCLFFLSFYCWPFPAAVSWFCPHHQHLVEEYVSIADPAGAYSIILGTSGTLVNHTTQLKIPYVGLVRALVDSASISIMPSPATSIPFESVMELINFKPGK
jgi:hypothetical protein